AGVSADRFAGIIDLDLRAHLFAIFADALRHFALLARVTVDLHEFQKQILNPFLIDHSDSPVIVIRNRELKLHGFGIESRILSNIWPKRKSASFGLLWVFLPRAETSIRKYSGKAAKSHVTQRASERQELACCARHVSRSIP